MPDISGFSSLSKAEKIAWLTENYFDNPQKAREILELYWNGDEKLQRLHDEFSENTITNYYLPFGVAPNFVINGKDYVVPMAIEESSVVAALSKAAKFWKAKGGFKAEVSGTTKNGQVHFMFKGEPDKLATFFERTKPALRTAISDLAKNMEKRGGGLLDISLIDKTDKLADYFQLDCRFETVDAMGANFINSCLEQIAGAFKNLADKNPDFEGCPVEILMAILSNYVPECCVRAEASCAVKDLRPNENDAAVFAKRFVEAIDIANADPRRAVTHNKGIMNGIDAVVLATGNDFRAVEAGVHAFAVRNGQYSSLTSAKIEKGLFKFQIEVPLALGTVGGLTRLHPLVKLALEMLRFPNARELMEIVAAVGLAQNFAAIGSLVTTGIQEGHMKMHLMNILNQFEATAEERSKIMALFKNKVVSHSGVLLELEKMRH